MAGGCSGLSSAATVRLTAATAPKATLAAIRDSDKDRFEIAVMVDDSDVPLWIIAARAVQGHSAPFVLDDRLYWLIKSELHMFLSTLIHGTRRQFLNSILQSGIQPAGAGELGRVHAYYAPFAPDDPRYRVPHTCRSGRHP